MNSVRKIFSHKIPTMIWFPLVGFIFGSLINGLFSGPLSGLVGTEERAKSIICFVISLILILVLEKALDYKESMFLPRGFLKGILFMLPMICLEVIIFFSGGLSYRGRTV